MMSDTTNDIDDIEAILDEIRPAERTVDICVRGDLSVRRAELEDELAAAIRHDLAQNGDSLVGAPATTRPIVDAIAEVEAEMRASIRTFRIAAIGASEWRELVAAHPPADDDLIGLRWDPLTFPAAAVARCCVSPVMTHEQAIKLEARLSDAQWEKLCTALYTANMGDDLPKFASGTAGAPTSAPSSTTAPLEESLTDSL